MLQTKNFLIYFFQKTPIIQAILTLSLTCIGLNAFAVSPRISTNAVGSPVTPASHRMAAKNLTVTNATKTSENSNHFLSKDFWDKITPEVMYSYIDFKFNSEMGENFNRYRGHSNVYATGGDHINLSEKLFAGLYYFRINTTVNSEFRILPDGIVTATQDIHNNTVFGHVLKVFTPQLFIDMAGAYGQNKLSSNFQSANSPLIGGERTASSNNSNSSWFVTLNGIYLKAWDKLVLRTNLGGLYVQTNSAGYQYALQDTLDNQIVQGLINKVTFIQENAELSYAVNPMVSPFINAGLIQVVTFQNSRDLLSDPFVGILPQLNLDKDGYRVGGGITFSNKNMTLRLEEKYYNAGETFESLQTVAAWEYRFD